VLSQNLFATTARGAFFLKGYRYAEPAPVAREHRVLAFLAERGIPAVSPLLTPGGESFLRVGGRIWAVFPRLADVQRTGDRLAPADAAAMGGALGRIHAALAQFPSAEAARYPVKLLWDSDQAMREMAGYEAAIGRLPTLAPFDQHALSSFAYRRTLLAAGLPGAEAFARLPSHVLHGDFHDGNVFFDRHGSVSGVVDWELAAVGPRAFELIRALDVALRLPADLDAGGARVQALLHAYIGEVDLTYEECMAMPEMYLAHRVHSLWVYEEHYRLGSARTDQIAMQDIADLEWWIANRRRVALALADSARAAPRPRVVTYDA
jgi:homoserine kinase type II